MKGSWIQYSAEELAWIEARKHLPRRQLHADFCLRWGRDDVSMDNLKGLCTRKGWGTGRTGCFEPGQIPPNKGHKGYCAPGSEKGWFKKGARHGKARALYKPIGTERLSKDGYLERKVHDEMPLQSRWRAVHLIRWEEVNGPLPERHCLKCIDGDKTNTDPDNWACIPRALLPKLNARWSGVAYDDAPAELKPTILAAARLHHAARELRKETSK
ncbi:MAG: HNH endonuclease [Pseudodonghicola sp.]